MHGQRPLLGNSKMANQVAAMYTILRRMGGSMSRANGVLLDCSRETIQTLTGASMIQWEKIHLLVDF